MCDSNDWYEGEIVSKGTFEGRTRRLIRFELGLEGSVRRLFEARRCTVLLSCYCLRHLRGEVCSGVVLVRMLIRRRRSKGSE
jgi:hypothetical protein